MTEAKANDDTKGAIRNLEESPGERAKDLSRSLSLRELYIMYPQLIKLLISALYTYKQLHSL
jgi:hypothetical protein